MDRESLYLLQTPILAIIAGTLYPFFFNSFMDWPFAVYQSIISFFIIFIIMFILPVKMETSWDLVNKGHSGSKDIKNVEICRNEAAPLILHLKISNIRYRKYLLLIIKDLWLEIFCDEGYLILEPQILGTLTGIGINNNGLRTDSFNVSNDTEMELRILVGAGKRKECRASRIGLCIFFSETGTLKNALLKWLLFINKKNLKELMVLIEANE